MGGGPTASKVGRRYDGLLNPQALKDRPEGTTGRLNPFCLSYTSQDLTEEERQP